MAAVQAMAIVGASVARWLWWRPWRRPLLQAQLSLAALTVLMVLGARWRVTSQADREAVGLALVVVFVLLLGALWFLVVWRAHRIEARLGEQAEREKAIEMARRLAAAQVEPHFLFNTLASVQHWVQVKHDRAAPLLAALIGYLRATLPLFDRPLLHAGPERHRRGAPDRQPGARRVRYRVRRPCLGRIRWRRHRLPAQAGGRRSPGADGAAPARPPGAGGGSRSRLAGAVAAGR